MAEKNEYVEQIKHEWRKCAKFIRGTYSFAYPSFFDAHFEGDMDKHLKNNIPNRGVVFTRKQKPVPTVSLEEFKKIKEERDDFLKILRMENKRGLKLQKDRHTVKIKLIEKAIKFGLVEKIEYHGIEQLIHGSNIEFVTDEWDELQDWVNRQRTINLKLGKDLLSAVKKPKGEKPLK